MREMFPTNNDAVIRQLEVATATHDLRNRLSIACCQLHELRCRAPIWPRDARIGRSLASVAGLLEQTNTLLESLLESMVDQVRMPVSTRCAADIVRVMRELTADNLYSNHSVEVVTTVRRLTGPWDTSRLAVVLRVLLDNAVKYCPDPGCVSVEIEANEEWAAIAVQDHGIGIPAEDLPHVFEPFFRARNVASDTPGLGLGLPTARLIVEQYGGVLDVESIEGQGSRFTMRLPLMFT